MAPKIVFPSSLCYHLCPAVIVKQLPYRLIGELLQEFSQLLQRELLHPVGLGVPRCGCTALNGCAIVVHTAVGVPQVVWDVDTLHVVLDNPVVCRGNGPNQHKSCRALFQEKVGELGLMDPPGILVRFGVLRNHIGQGESGVTARDCKREEWKEIKKCIIMWLDRMQRVG